MAGARLKVATWGARSHPRVQPLAPHRPPHRFRRCPRSPDKIKFTFQPTVLFTHQWAWIVTRGAAVVGCLKPDKWYDFVDYCFEHQEEYQHAAGENKTPKQMEALMAKFAKEVADIDEEAFATEYASDRNFLTAKEPQRVAIVRQIWSVPTFFVNGFENDKVGSSTSKDEWVAYLKDMVGDGGAAGGAGK